MTTRFWSQGGSIKAQAAPSKMPLFGLDPGTVAASRAAGVDQGSLLEMGKLLEAKRNRTLEEPGAGLGLAGIFTESCQQPLPRFAKAEDRAGLHPRASGSGETQYLGSVTKLYKENASLAGLRHRHVDSRVPDQRVLYGGPAPPRIRGAPLPAGILVGLLSAPFGLCSTSPSRLPPSQQVFILQTYGESPPLRSTETRNTQKETLQTCDLDRLFLSILASSSSTFQNKGIMFAHRIPLTFCCAKFRNHEKPYRAAKH